MAFPFAPMPTWSAFLAIARAQGVRLRTSKGKLIDPHGDTSSIRYLIREGFPPLIHPQLQSSDRLTPTMLGYLCRRLEIDPSPLGISAEDLPSDDWL